MRAASLQGERLSERCSDLAFLRIHGNRCVRAISSEPIGIASFCAKTVYSQCLDHEQRNQGVDHGVPAGVATVGLQRCWWVEKEIDMMRSPNRLGFGTVSLLRTTSLEANLPQYHSLTLSFFFNCFVFGRPGGFQSNQSRFSSSDTFLPNYLPIF